MNVDRKKLKLTKKTLFSYKNKKETTKLPDSLTADPIITAMTITGTGPA